MVFTKAQRRQSQRDNIDFFLKEKTSIFRSQSSIKKSIVKKFPHVAKRTQFRNDKRREQLRRRFAEVRDKRKRNEQLQAIEDRLTNGEFRAIDRLGPEYERLLKKRQRLRGKCAIQDNCFLEEPNELYLQEKNLEDEDEQLQYRRNEKRQWQIYEEDNMYIDGKWQRDNSRVEYLEVEKEQEKSKKINKVNKQEFGQIFERSEERYGDEKMMNGMQQEEDSDDELLDWMLKLREQAKNNRMECYENEDDGGYNVKGQIQELEHEIVELEI